MYNILMIFVYLVQFSNYGMNFLKKSMVILRVNYKFGHCGLKKYGYSPKSFQHASLVQNHKFFVVLVP